MTVTAVATAAAATLVAVWLPAVSGPASVAAAPAATRDGSTLPSSTAADVPSRSNRARPARAEPPVDPESSGFPVGTPVLLLGDSLAVGIADTLAASLPGRAVTVEAAEGRGTATATDLVADHAAGSARIWVVSLGTNDSPADFATAAAALMALAGPRRCVLWYDVWRVGTHDEINAQLGALVERHRNLHVLQWHAAAEEHPDWFSNEDVHPSTDGYLARSQMASDSVTSVCTSTG